MMGCVHVCAVAVADTHHFDDILCACVWILRLMCALHECVSFITVFHIMYLQCQGHMRAGTYTLCSCYKYNANKCMLRVTVSIQTRH